VPNPFHVAVSGLIGAGKSTLVRGLAPLLAASPLLERFDADPYFERFYSDPARWAFQHFTFFFEQSLDDQRRARQDGVSAVQERVIQEHLKIFGAEFHARGFLGDDDFDVLSRLTDTCAMLTGPPDLLVQIDIEVDEAMRRLEARARPAERAIDSEYLQALANRYEAFLAGWEPRVRVMRIAAADYDFRVDDDLRLLAGEVTALLDEVGTHADPVARRAGLWEGHTRT
jgi:deoxyadenosine/deoxycytidine kinase